MPSHLSLLAATEQAYCTAYLGQLELIDCIRFNSGMKHYQKAISMMHKQNGLTLIELMVTLVILGIIAGVAVPRLGNLFTGKNIQSTGKIFEQSIRVARSEAANRGVPMIVRPKSASNDWADGWEIVFLDADGNDELVREFSPIPGDLAFSTTDFDSGTPLILDPTGRVRSHGTFTLKYGNCQKSSYDLQFEILVSGLVKKTKIACN